LGASKQKGLSSLPRPSYIYLDVIYLFSATMCIPYLPQDVKYAEPIIFLFFFPFLFPSLFLLISPI